MKITNKSSGEYVLRERNTIAKISQMPTTDAMYGVWLPGGSQYEITFVKPSGAATWPGYAYLNMESPPECAEALGDDEVHFVYPAPTARCVNPIFNGDIETGLIDGWQEYTNYKPFGDVISPGADGSSYALKTKYRISHNNGGGPLVNRVDIR